MKKVIYSDMFSKEKYEVIVLDMDGTLYYQRSMQFFMCMEMGIYGIRHPFSLWKFKIIGLFRKIREQSEYSMVTCSDDDKETVHSSLLEYQYAITAKQMDRPVEEICAVVEEWMFERPLKYLWSVRDKQLCEWVMRWREQGKKVVVYSDYPVEKKVKALAIEVDAMYCSDNARISQMKPSTKGMEIICEDLQVTPDSVLVVGDRMSKDGKMAETAGSDYVILKKWKFPRCRYY